MKALKIKPTNSTPAVDFSVDGKMSLEGRSFPENANKFYKPLFNWADGLGVETVTLDINLEYFSSASGKKLHKLLKSLDTNKNIKSLIINWHYEEGDEDMLESGRIFEKLLKKAQFIFCEFKSAN
jgi:hypothetical protein